MFTLPISFFNLFFRKEVGERGEYRRNAGIFYIIIIL